MHFSDALKMQYIRRSFRVLRLLRAAVSECDSLEVSTFSLSSLLSGVLNEVGALLVVVGRKVGYGELVLFVTVITEVDDDEILGALYLYHIGFITFPTVS